MAMKRCLLYDMVNTSELLAKIVVCLLIEKKKKSINFSEFASWPKSYSPSWKSSQSMESLLWNNCHDELSRENNLSS